MATTTAETSGGESGGNGSAEVWARALWSFVGEASNDDAGAEDSPTQELSFESGDMIKVLGKPFEDDGEGGWWYGAMSSGLEGIFPSNYVQLESFCHADFQGIVDEVVREHGDGNDDPNATYSHTAMYTDAEVSVTKALYDFEGSRSADLTMRAGDKLVVLFQYTSGWWFGVNVSMSSQDTCACGHFPRNYVVLNEDETNYRMSVSAIAETADTFDVNAPLSSGGTNSAVGGGHASDPASRVNKRPYSLRSLDSFDALLTNGFTVEVKPPEDGTSGPETLPQKGQVVELECDAMTWNGADLESIVFASTKQSNTTMKIRLDGECVTSGLEAGILRCPLGHTAIVTCTPRMAYGDVGLQPLVKPHAYVIYDIKVHGAYEDTSKAQVFECVGPFELLTHNTVARQNAQASTEDTLSPLPSHSLPPVQSRTDTAIAMQQAGTATEVPHVSDDGEVTDDMLNKAKEMMHPQPTTTAPPPPQPKTAESSSPMTTAAEGPFYTLAQLTIAPFPEGVDVQHREKYLSPADFQETFGMDQAAFYAQPQWKQKKLKQGKALF